MAKGSSDVQLQQAMASTGVASARVLHFEGTEMAFGGFENEATGRALQQNTRLLRTKETYSAARTPKRTVVQEQAEQTALRDN